MGDTIRFKKGLKSEAPVLDIGMPGFNTDDNSLFIGGANGNVEFSNKEYIDKLANPSIWINGDFQVWQRGTSFTGNGYTADRWFVAQGNSTLSTLNNKNAIRIARTSSDTDETNLEYKMEQLPDMRGKTYTLSWEGMSNVDLTYSTLIFFHGDNGSKEFINTEVKEYKANILTKHTITFTLPDDIDSKYTVMGVRILRRANVNEHVITITNVKLELGDRATPFISRPYAQELALCQRYYYGWSNERARYRADGVNTNQLIFTIPLPTTMRIAPTLNDSFTINQIGGAEVSGFTFECVNTPIGLLVYATKNNHGLTDGQLMIKDNKGLDSELY